MTGLQCINEQMGWYERTFAFCNNDRPQLCHYLVVESSMLAQLCPRCGKDLALPGGKLNVDSEMIEAGLLTCHPAIQDRCRTLILKISQRTSVSSSW